MNLCDLMTRMPMIPLRAKVTTAVSYQISVPTGRWRRLTQGQADVAGILGDELEVSSLWGWELT